MDTTEVEELRELNRLLLALLEDPHPGLFTWNQAMSKLLMDVSQFANRRGDWRDAIGAAPGFLGEEKSEDVIRRMRDEEAD